MRGKPSPASDPVLIGTADLPLRTDPFDPGYVRLEELRTSRFELETSPDVVLEAPVAERREPEARRHLARSDTDDL